MSEDLEKIKPTDVTLKIKGKERQIKFNFSAWAKLEEKYGGVSNFSKIDEDLKNTPFKTIPELLYIGLIDKEGVTQDNILEDYDFSDLEDVVQKLTTALYNSLPQNKKKLTKTPKNQ